MQGPAASCGPPAPHHHYYYYYYYHHYYYYYYYHHLWTPTCTGTLLIGIFGDLLGAAYLVAPSLQACMFLFSLDITKCFYK